MHENIKKIAEALNKDIMQSVVNKMAACKIICESAEGSLVTYKLVKDKNNNWHVL